MGFAIFFVGGLSGIAGMIMLLFNRKLLDQIVEATAGEPEGLKRIELNNIYQTIRFKKLLNLSRVGNSDVQIKAKKAIRLELLFYFFMVLCMVLMVVGLELDFRPGSL